MIRAEFVVVSPSCADGGDVDDPPRVGIWLGAYVYLPKFKRGKPVSFIMDTGAESSVLDISDAKLLIPRRSLFKGYRMAAPREAEGIGGTAWYYPEKAYIVLEHEDGSQDLIEQTIDIPVASNDNWNATLGSLLGMDLLTRYLVTIDFSRPLVSLEYPGDGDQPASPLAAQ